MVQLYFERGDAACCRAIKDFLLFGQVGGNGGYCPVVYVGQFGGQVDDADACPCVGGNICRVVVDLPGNDVAVMVIVLPNAEHHVGPLCFNAYALRKPRAVRYLLLGGVFCGRYAESDISGELFFYFKIMVAVGGAQVIHPSVHGVGCVGGAEGILQGYGDDFLAASA